MQTLNLRVFLKRKLDRLSYWFVLISSIIIAQTEPPKIEWDKVYGGNNYDYIEGNSKNTIQTNDGGFILVTLSYSGVSGEKTESNFGESDLWVIKVDSLGQINWQKILGSIEFESPNVFVQHTSDGGYLIGCSSRGRISGNKTVTTETEDNFKEDIWVLKIDSIGNILWQNTYGGVNNSDYLYDVTSTTDGGFLISGFSETSLSVSGSKSEKGYGNYDIWIFKIDENGNQLWDKSYGGASNDGKHYALSRTIQKSDGGFIIATISNSSISGNKSGPKKNPIDYPINYSSGFDIWLIEIDSYGNILNQKVYGGDRFDGVGDFIKSPDGGYLLFGYTLSSSFSGDISGNTYGVYDLWILKLNSDLEKEWDKVYGSSVSEKPSSVILTEEGNYMFFANSSNPQGVDPLSSGNRTVPMKGRSDIWVFQLDAAGNYMWQTAIGGSYSESVYSVIKTADGGYLLTSQSNSGISLDRTHYHRGYGDIWLLKLGCPYNTEEATNTLNPENQTVCSLGTPQEIIGTDDQTLFGDVFTYQWQESIDAINWIDIPFANGINFLPPEEIGKKHYRRIANWACEFQDISNVSTVTISSQTAASITESGPFVTCSNSSITIGGTPTAIGEATPLVYSWDNTEFLNDATVSNPIATVDSTTVFTLTVTDSNGCQKVGQYVVTVLDNVAGPDVAYCNGSSGVKIGKPPIVGLPSVTYSWSPSTGLNDSTIAQPIASPTVNTSYFLTMTFINNDGNQCIITDEVEVTVEHPPAANFAGPDQVLCFGETATLGTPAVAGFSYVWTPGQYLSTNNTSEVVFNPGDAAVISPNPITYTVTASNEGCIYTDQITVFQINSDANMEECGPRLLGTPDNSPSISENYSWTKDPSSTGNSTFLSNTDIPQPSISANTTGEDIYNLTVTYGDTVCQDSVLVPICNRCSVIVESDNQNFCAIYKDKPIKLIADGGGSTNYTYSWSPAEGLNTTTGAVVELLDNINRTYTVTKSSTIDTTYFCTETIEVNNAEWSIPTINFNNKLSGCLGDTISLGSAVENGYSYRWEGPNGFTSLESNPSFTLTEDNWGAYSVRITDMTSGCVIQDTVTVELADVEADAGSDIEVCSPTLITLGQPDPSNGQWAYSWSPSGASWQNGTDENTPNPQVLVAANMTFTLTVTNTLTGCTSSDSVDVIFNSSPTLTNLADVVELCPESSFQIGSPAIPGVAYQWTPAVGLSNPNVAQPIVTAGTIGSSTVYTVSAIFPGSCNFNPSATVTINVIDPSFDLGSDINYCPASGPVSIGNNAPTQEVRYYSWSPATGLSNITIANPTSTVSEKTTYTLIVTYDNGCVAQDDIVVIPNSNPEAGFDRSICKGNTTTLGSENNSGMISWTAVGTPDGTPYLSSTSIGNPVFDASLSGGAPEGTYVLEINQTINNCTNTDIVEVTVASAPNIVGTPVNVCTNGCTTIGVEDNYNYSYNWSPSVGISATNTPMVEVCPTETTTYKLTVTDILSGCNTEASYLVTVLPIEAPEIETQDILVCATQSQEITTTTTNGSGSYSYEWSPQLGLNDPYSASPIVTIAATTEYQVTVTDNTTGCSNSNSVTVFVDSGNGDYITLQPADSKECSGSSILFSVDTFTPGSYAYQWQINQYGIFTNITNEGIFSGATSKTLYISDNSELIGSSVRVIVSNITGCQLSDISYEAIIDHKDPIVIINESTIYCPENTLTLDGSGSATGPTIVYSWSSSNGGELSGDTNNITATALTTGFYTLTVTDTATGCSSSDEIEINFTPIIEATGVNPTTCGGNGSIDLTLINVEDGIYTINHANGSFSEVTVSGGLSTISEVSVGVYKDLSITVNSCTSTEYPEISITNPEPPTIADHSIPEICSGTPFIYVPESTALDFDAVSYTWTVTSPNGITGASDENIPQTEISQVLTNSTLSTQTVVYSITANLEGGCNTTFTLEVPVTPTPVNTNGINDLEICSGNNINISLFNVNGLSYNWTSVSNGVIGSQSSGTTNQIISETLSTSGDSDGTITYTITPIFGNCIGEDFTVLAVVHALPKPNIMDGAICDIKGITSHFTLDTGLTDNDYSFEWYLDGVLIPEASQSTYTATQAGIYKVLASHNTTLCKSQEASAEVVINSSLIDFNITVSNPFVENNFIEITPLNGTGNYKYSLDGGKMQLNNVFNNISAGEHVVKVIDIGGCGEKESLVYIIDYPRHFSPNGDKHLDTWTVESYANIKIKRIEIFDQHGKLIKQINSGEKGWDGTYLGNDMQSNTYWFKLIYFNTNTNITNQFFSKFALMR